MAETITVDSVSVGASVPPESVEWVESAYLGEVGEGHFTYEDTIGTKAFTGHKSISVAQSSSSNSRIFTGFVATKRIKRGETTNRLAQRDIVVGTKDLNDLLQRRILVQSSTASNTATTAVLAGKRPAETISARLTWLLASPALSTLVADYGAVSYPTDLLDANDFRGQFPGDVLASMAKAVGYNYYVRYNGAAKGELVFRDDNASTANTSTISISNYPGAADNVTVFAPKDEPELTQDPEHVYSGNYYTYSTGQDYATRTATATAFVERDGVSDDAGNKTLTAASRDAKKFLDESDDEEQMLPVTIRMAKGHVGAVQAGQRISVRMTHLATEGWDPARYARVLRKRITQPLNTDDDYDVTLDLSPQETAPVAASCSTLYANTVSATYYPLGGSGNIPNVVGTNIAYYFRSGLAEPYAPTPTYAGLFHWPTYGLGGLGTIDYFASGYGNILKFLVVGNGTLTITTNRWSGQLQPYTVQVFHVQPGALPQIGSTVTGTAGAATAVTITTAVSGSCIHIIDLRCDARTAAYIGMGWSQAVWVAA